MRHPDFHGPSLTDLAEAVTNEAQRQAQEEVDRRNGITNIEEAKHIGAQVIQLEARHSKQQEGAN